MGLDMVFNSRYCRHEAERGRVRQGRIQKMGCTCCVVTQYNYIAPPPMRLYIITATRPGGGHGAHPYDSGGALLCPVGGSGTIRGFRSTAFALVSVFFLPSRPGRKEERGWLTWSTRVRERQSGVVRAQQKKVQKKSLTSKSNRV